jgi:hypothetical protein
MPEVDYQHVLPYLPPEDGEGGSFPGLWVEVEPIGSTGASIGVQAHIDTGAEYSVFNGFIAQSIELDLLAGEPVSLVPISGQGLAARFHLVRISHDILGPFELKVAFSLGEIQRNLLGRDFLNLIQIGFRERHIQMYITPLP